MSSVEKYGTRGKPPTNPVFYSKVPGDHLQCRIYRIRLENKVKFGD